MNYLFYSNYCQYSKELLKLIIDNNFNTYFKFICIDDDNIKIPDLITNVPSIIINNINKVLMGNEAFEWVKLQKFININTNNSTKIINNDGLPVNKNEKNYDNTKTIFTYIEDNIDISSNRFRNINIEDEILETNNIDEPKISLEQQNNLINEEINKRKNDLQFIFNNYKYSRI